MKGHLFLIILLILAVLYVFSNMQGVHTKPRDIVVSNHKADLLYNIYED